MTMVMACTNLQAQLTEDSARGLKDYYKNYFAMGVAVSPQALKRAAESQLVLRQFNSITPENAMKMGPIHPKENQYNWTDADAIVKFAQAPPA